MLQLAVDYDDPSISIPVPIDSWWCRLRLAHWSCQFSFESARLIAPITLSNLILMIQKLGFIARKLEMKIPPPIVMLLCALLMWYLQYLFPRQSLPESIRIGGLALSLVIAAVTAIAAVVQFRRQRTTIHPFTPHQSSRIVTDGIFRFSRNPMYLAMAFALIGYSSFLGSFAYALGGLLAYISFITTFQIVPEERALTAKFGDHYRQYLTRTRRWL